MPVRSGGEDVVDEEGTSAVRASNSWIDLEAGHEVIGSWTSVRRVVVKGRVPAVAESKQRNERQGGPSRLDTTVQSRIGVCAA